MMLKRKSVWGACKRALHDVPEIWDMAREYTEGLESQMEQESFLLSVLCYASFGIPIESFMASLTKCKLRKVQEAIENHMDESFDRQFF